MKNESEPVYLYFKDVKYKLVSMLAQMFIYRCFATAIWMSVQCIDGPGGTSLQHEIVFLWECFICLLSLTDHLSNIVGNMLLTWVRFSNKDLRPYSQTFWESSQRAPNFDETFLARSSSLGGIQETSQNNSEQGEHFTSVGRCGRPRCWVPCVLFKSSDWWINKCPFVSMCGVDAQWRWRELCHKSHREPTNPLYQMKHCHIKIQLTPFQILIT